MTIYSRAVPTGVVRDYAIAGNSEDFVCFSCNHDTKAKGPPVLSLEKTADKAGYISYKLYSRVSGKLKTYEDSFTKLSVRLESELKTLKRNADAKIARPRFGR